MTITTNELPAVLKAHRMWLREEGGSRANLTEADLSGADLTRADLTRANHIVAFGPVGAEKLIGYAVRHGDVAMVKLGCFWGTQKDALAAISEKYGLGSKYAAFVSAACSCLMEG